MSLQGATNQALSIASFFVSSNPAIQEKIKTRSEGERIQASQAEAKRGLSDLKTNFERIEKGEKQPYSETQLSDIEGRIKYYNQNIQNAKVAALNPQYEKYVDPKYYPHEELTSDLQTLESNIKSQREQMKAKAMQNLADEQSRVSESRWYNVIYD